MVCFIRKSRKYKFIPKLILLQYLSITILVIIFGALLTVFGGFDYSASEDVRFIQKNELKINQHLNFSYKLIHNENLDNIFIRISSNINQLHTKKLCYKEGTERTQRASQDIKTDFYVNQTDCICHSEWHGSACSIPEIIWRAFINSRLIMNHAPKIITNPNTIVYIIKILDKVNLETLEMQIMEFLGVVNFFILCEKSISPTLLSHMKYGLFLKHRKQILLLNDNKCSGKYIHTQMMSILAYSIKPMDIIIYGSADEILNRKSIEFLKWHTIELYIITFRLKWNVYGFFFQHPEKTIIRSIAIQYQLLEWFQGDLDRITTTSENAFIVGDLNHYGGWYCEFCHEVGEIVSSINHDQLIKLHNNIAPVINREFVENLIRNRKYVDGKTELLKQYNNDGHDKYFIPNTARTNHWKFENIITNYYARLEDDIEDDYY